jgi:AbrB family looped-hinge helix DNA binding protein
MTIIVSEDGTITIPKEVSERLGMRPGEALEIRGAERGLVLAPREATAKLPRSFDPVAYRATLERMRGSLATGQTTDEIIEELRGPADTVDPE